MVDGGSYISIGDMYKGNKIILPDRWKGKGLSVSVYAALDLAYSTYLQVINFHNLRMTRKAVSVMVCPGHKVQHCFVSTMIPKDTQPIQLTLLHVHAAGVNPPAEKPWYLYCIVIHYFSCFRRRFEV